MVQEKNYYLGLDIGTDSVGYAVADRNYTLMKRKGEPMWGTHLFEGGKDCAERRGYRTNRRRINRRQQRVAWLTELFAPQIIPIDPYFFRRRKASALYGDDAAYGIGIFQGDGITDEEYHKTYPTIHHLLLDLMTNPQPHDVRLVYLACAWLVAHRGHFLFSVSPDRVDELLDFHIVYERFLRYFTDQEYNLPWGQEIDSETILTILQMESGVRRKSDAFKAKVFGGKKINKEKTEEFPFSLDAIVTLLSGGTVEPAKVFQNNGYKDMDKVSLAMDEDEFLRIVSELGEDGELLTNLRRLSDCAQLKSAMRGAECISAGKVQVYEQHKRDLQQLKYFVKTYCPEKYNEIFRDAVAGNYVFYTKNVKSCSAQAREKVGKIADKDEFCTFLLKRMRVLSVKEADEDALREMIQRLEVRTFLPKQRDGDNRVIPQQIYRYELAEILKNARLYLPFLSQKNREGITAEEKILSIFDFRIPYYVGPLAANGGAVSWVKRKQQGKILPWNFEQMVDLDQSEEEFINRMTNNCTYLVGEDVLPANSLLYSAYIVLNTINNLRINGNKIPVSVKQAIFNDVYCRYPRVSMKKIHNYLVQTGHMSKQDTLIGMDEEVKVGLKSYHIFKRMLDSGILQESDVERIVAHAAYTEDRSRMRKWLTAEFPQLEKNDAEYILRQNLKEFGRLSHKFLIGLYGTEINSDGEAFTVMEALWNTNENLMQLLSNRYTFTQQIDAHNHAHYAENHMTLNDRLNEMYVSNAVKRSVFRTLDIVQDVVKVTGRAPKKIFVEMARGASPEQKGKRTKTRKAQLLELYQTIKTEDARQFIGELEQMGETADNRLQSDRLFLYYLQMGKCAYTGNPIELSKLNGRKYNLDHIYPQCMVKDDSVLNNLVLVESEINDRKKDIYPVPEWVREKGSALWKVLHEMHLMTDEKYRRLIRVNPLTDAERMNFINRQLVETRQSAKVVASLLQEFYPESEIVYVKAGLVAEFRQELDLRKSRSVNDLHHSKDAYLNIVAGNLYHERFNRKWFRLDSGYNVQMKRIMDRVQMHGETCYWHGQDDIERIKKILAKDAVHLTRYAFFRKGGLFDQQPLKKAPDLIPLKKGLPTEKYGGYRKPTASFYVLARFLVKKKRELRLIPINLLDAERFMEDATYARQVVEREIIRITGKTPEHLELMLRGHPLKINTVFSLDGTRVTLAGKSGGGKIVMVSPLVSLHVGGKWESYIKAIESFFQKQKTNADIRLDEAYDHISREENAALYQLLTDKMGAWPFSNLPNNQAGTLASGKERFLKLSTEEQIETLKNILLLFSSGAGGTDLSLIGGSKKSGVTALSSNLENWKKNYQDVRIVHTSASGLFENLSENLLELL